MKQMWLLSASFHMVLLVVLFLPLPIWSKKHSPPIVHHVELIQIPQETVRKPDPPAPKKSKAVVKKPRPAVKKVQRAKKDTRPAQKKPPRIKKKAVSKVVQPRPPEKKRPVVKKEVAPAPKPPKSPPPMQLAKKESDSEQIFNVPKVRPVLEERYREYEFYHSWVSRVIKKRWSPPPVTPAGEPVEAMVAFTLTPTGQISGRIQLVKSSGNLFYDQAALRATQGPFPPPPPGYPAELLDIKLVYILDQDSLD